MPENNNLRYYPLYILINIHITPITLRKCKRELNITLDIQQVLVLSYLCRLHLFSISSKLAFACVLGPRPVWIIRAIQKHRVSSWQKSSLACLRGIELNLGQDQVTLDIKIHVYQWNSFGVRNITDFQKTTLSLNYMIMCCIKYLFIYFIQIMGVRFCYHYGFTLRNFFKHFSLRSFNLNRLSSWTP